MSEMLNVICSPEAGRGVHVENQKEEDDLMKKKKKDFTSFCPANTADRL